MEDPWANAPSSPKPRPQTPERFPPKPTASSPLAEQQHSSSPSLPIQSPPVHSKTLQSDGLDIEDGEFDDYDEFDDGPVDLDHTGRGTGSVSNGIVEGDDGFGDFGDFEEGDFGDQIQQSLEADIQLEGNHWVREIPAPYGCSS
jgi:hypothetical protein